MNKLNLVQILLKDLEEIKLLSEEAVATEKNPSLIIELALSKSRLLSQEIELLRDVLIQENKLATDEIADEPETDAADDDAQVAVSDPELEIMNFEMSENQEDIEPELEENIDDEPEPEFEPEPEPEEIADEEPVQEEPEKMETEETTPEIGEDVVEEAEEEEDEEIHEEEQEEEEDQDVAVEEEESDEVEEPLEEPEETVEETIPEPETEPEVKDPNIEFNELKSDPQPGFREINIEDIDDDDIEPITFAPTGGIASQPVMREIPKPEEPEMEQPEKKVVGEKFQKEKSLNEAIGENKSADSKLTNGPISSLRATIGLNDRFLFIREIFDNNADKYNLIIDHLDKLETIQQAVDYLRSNLTLQKNDTSMKFVELLKRRFTK